MLQCINIFVGDEAKATRLASSFVSENRTIFDLTEFYEKLFELLVLQVVREATDEYFPKLRVNILDDFFLNVLNFRGHL